MKTLIEVRSNSGLTHHEVKVSELILVVAEKDYEIINGQAVQVVKTDTNRFFVNKESIDYMIKALTEVKKQL